jgi:PAS domain S-box-containing protein
MISVLPLDDAPRTDREPFSQSRADNLPDYIIVYGQDGKIRYVNAAAAEALEYDAETMIQTPFLSYVAEEFREQVTARMAEHHDTGSIPLYETELVAQHGIRRSVIVKGTEIRYHDHPATLLFLIDITRRKELEDQLAARAAELFQISTAFQQANKKLAVLSSITRHDIGNQLTVVKGYLGILETEQSDPALRAYCLKAMTASDRISAMIRFTKEYEEIGVHVPVWQDCRILVDRVSNESALRKLNVINNLPAGMEIFADPLVARVFYNLMDNALRYGGKITAVRFSVQESGDGRQILCEDDGEGIPALEKERIFDRGSGKTTGLGLALSREILDITGITIRETGEPGKGARFEITVPKGMLRFG